MKRLFVFVQKGDKGLHSSFEMKGFLPKGFFVFQMDCQDRIQKSQLPESMGQCVEGKLIGFHNCHVGPETDNGPSLGRFTKDGQRSIRCPFMIGLAMNQSVLVNLQKKRFRKGIDHGDTDAVKSP